MVPIDVEVKEKRNQNEKHFRKIDGTYEVSLYDYAVHYLENGKWEDIDNTLNDLITDYENKKNDFKVKFPKKLDDNKSISVKLDNYQVSWNFININETAIETDQSNLDYNQDKRILPKVSQRVLYPDINDNVNLEYILLGNELKENIIVNQY